MTEETREIEQDPNITSIATRKTPQRYEPVQFVDSFGDPVDIFTDGAIPEFDCGPIKAYRAKGREKSPTDFYALVCEKHILPRIYASSIYKNFENPNLTSLVSNGAAYWPPAKQERYIFLYKSIPGKRIHMPGSEEALAWRQEVVMETIVKPMALMFKEFKDSGFVHGAIRPSNMFAISSGVKVTQVVLGDCLSMPPSALQPALYEPIERAMADPLGRGEGTLADDLYSWGVSLAVILRAHDPLREMNDHDIILEKIENGSYAAITGKDRFKGSILELLRGLLHDDPKERWTVEEVMTWLDGRRLSPKQALKHKKAARPLMYAGRKYLYASCLAMDIDTDPQETVRIVEAGDLDQWLERSLEDEEIIERVALAVKTAREKGAGPGYEDRLASHLSIALDPMAPLRYRGLHLTGEGIGISMAEAAILKHDLQRFVDLFSLGTAFSWLTSSKNPTLDTGSLISKFDQCRNYIRHGKPGYGIERCVYLLATECPCLSDKLKDYYVQTPEQMILAFEDLCQKGQAPAMFLDRHSMAFLAVKDAKVLDPYLFDLSSFEDYRKIMGNLKCLGTIQKRANLPPFPGIARVFVGALPAVYARYHDREVREKLESTVKKYAAEGDLMKMAALLSNGEVINKDFQSFRIAMGEYAELSREAHTLGQQLEHKNSFGRGTGKEFAAAVSAVIAGIIILTTASMFFANHSTF